MLALRHDRPRYEAAARCTALAAAFLSGLKERYALAEAELLVDDFGYLTAPARTDLSGHLEYTHRDKTKKWF